MDTQNDIEACGGCQFPQLGEAEGADCTELEGVDEVAVSLVCTSMLITDDRHTVQGRRMSSHQLHSRL